MDKKQDLMYRCRESSALSLYFKTECIVLEEMVGSKRVFSDIPLSIIDIVSEAWAELVLSVSRATQDNSQEAYDNFAFAVDKASQEYMRIIEEEYVCDQVSVWLKLHSTITLKYLLHIISTAKDQGGFELIISCFSECLNYTLFELHELDTICTTYNKDTGKLVPFFLNDVEGTLVRLEDRREMRNTPFLAFDCMSLHYLKVFKSNPLEIRYLAYKQYFEFAPSEIEIKSYVETQCDEEEIAKPMRELGVMVAVV